MARQRNDRALLRGRSTQPLRLTLCATVSTQTDVSANAYRLRSRADLLVISPLFVGAARSQVPFGRIASALAADVRFGTQLPSAVEPALDDGTIRLPAVA